MSCVTSTARPYLRGFSVHHSVSGTHLPDGIAQHHSGEAGRSGPPRASTVINFGQGLACAYLPPDPAGRCVYVNERWTEWTGLPSEAALGDGWLQSLHPDDRHACWKKAARPSNPVADLKVESIAALERHEPLDARPRGHGTGEDGGIIGYVRHCLTSRNSNARPTRTRKLLSSRRECWKLARSAAS